MARHLTLLTLALVTATQTAEAFPHYTDFGGRTLQATHAKSRNSIYDAAGNAASVESYEVVGDHLRSQNEFDRSLVRIDLLILEVAAEEDPALADAFESVLEMHLDADETLEVMLVLVAMVERGIYDYPGDIFDPVDTGMLNLLAIEAEKSAAWIDRSIPPHRNRH